MSLRNPELAEKRAKVSIAAADVLLDNRQAIEEVCNWAQEDEVVLAVIKHDLTFGGAGIVPLRQLREQVMERQETGWALVFSPGATDKDIEERCAKMKQSAQARLDAIQRWREKHKENERSNDFESGKL